MSKAVIYYSLTGNTKEAAKEIARKLGAKYLRLIWQSRFRETGGENACRRMQSHLEEHRK